MSSFYVDLTSNTDVENSVANFKNKIELYKPLFGDWEVALVEISYTKSWKNLRHSYILWINRPESGAYTESKKLDIIYLPDLMERKGILRAGYYDSIHRFIQEINTEYDEVLGDKAPKVWIDDITRLVYIKMNADISGDYVPDFPSEVRDILGFTETMYLNRNYLKIGKDKIIPSVRPGDLEAWLHTLYVYCDIVEPQYVGNTKAKLLRAVEVPNNPKCGDQIVIKYDYPHYIPVLVNDFDEIEIDIKDDIGQRIPFMFGRTRLKLHFRPVKNE